LNSIKLSEKESGYVSAAFLMSAVFPVIYTAGLVLQPDSAHTVI